MVLHVTMVESSPTVLADDLCSSRWVRACSTPPQSRCGASGAPASTRALDPNLCIAFWFTRSVHAVQVHAAARDNSGR